MYYFVPRGGVFLGASISNTYRLSISISIPKEYRYLQICTYISMMYERLTARQISQKDRISLSVVNLTTLAYRIKREDFHVARQADSWISPRHRYLVEREDFHVACNNLPANRQLDIASPLLRIWLSEKNSTSRVITYLPTDSWISPRYLVEREDFHVACNNLPAKRQLDIASSLLSG